MRFDEVQGRNMLYVAVRRIALMVGTLAIVALLIQNTITAAVAEREVQTLRMAYGKEVMVMDEETGLLVSTDEYIYPNLTLPTKADYGHYIWRSFSPWWKHPFRIGSGVFLVGSLDKRGWAVDLVSDMALRRWWMIVTVLITLSIRAIAGVKYNKMRDELNEKGTDIIIKEYPRLCNKRAVVYVIVLAVAVFLSVKTRHNLVWLILAATGVLTAEIIHFYKYAATQDPFHSGKRSAWVAVLTSGKWGTITGAVVEFFGMIFYVISNVIKEIASWPVRGIFKLIGESYDDYNKQKTAQERLEDDKPGTGAMH